MLNRKRQRNILRRGLNKGKLHFDISIPPDKDNYTGKTCPKCKKDFKIRYGTGLPDTDSFCCPYCSFKDKHEEFNTEDQIKYAKSVAMKKIGKHYDRAFADIADTLNFPGKNFSISTKTNPIKMPPVYSYQEKTDFETEVKCSNCSLEYFIYGNVSFCPDCCQKNS